MQLYFALKIDNGTRTSFINQLLLVWNVETRAQRYLIPISLISNLHHWKCRHFRQTTALIIGARAHLASSGLTSSPSETPPQRSGRPGWCLFPEHVDPCAASHRLIELAPASHDEWGFIISLRSSVLYEHAVKSWATPEASPYSHATDSAWPDHEENKAR